MGPKKYFQKSTFLKAQASPQKILIQLVGTRLRIYMSNKWQVILMTWKIYKPLI